MATGLVERRDVQHAPSVAPQQPPSKRRRVPRVLRRSRLRALTKLSTDAACDALVERTVRRASDAYATADIRVERVDIGRVRPLSRFVSPARLQTAERYLALLRRARCEPYVPA